MIAPAPRKPIPETICAAIRVGSLGELTNSLKPYADTTVNRAAPPPTSACVRSPATSSRAERSRPINAQSRTAQASRRISSPSPSFTTIAATSIASPRSRTQPAAPSTEHGAALTNTNGPRCLARQELARRLAYRPARCRVALSLQTAQQSPALDDDQVRSPAQALHGITCCL